MKIPRLSSKYQTWKNGTALKSLEIIAWKGPTIFLFSLPHYSSI
jgi:hypothetical protein